MSNTPPRSGLRTIAVRSATFLVAGVTASCWAASQLRPIRTLYSQ